DRFIQSPQAQAKYGDINDIMHVKMKATQDHMMAGMNAQMGAGGKLAGEVEPVEGISLDTWAEQQVKIASGGTIDDITKSLGIDILDCSNLGAWFSAYFSENALRNDGGIHKEFTRLTDKYKAKYASVKSDADINF